MSLNNRVSILNLLNETNEVSQIIDTAIPNKDLGIANTALSNVTNNAKISMAKFGMPGAKYKDLALGAAKSRYTAPADGWFAFGKRAGSSGQFFNVTYISPCTCAFWSDVGSGQSGNILGHLVPVMKGQIISIDYNASGQTVNCRFIYAHGSESEYTA